jgi:hypothetical protein
MVFSFYLFALVFPVFPAKHLLLPFSSSFTCSAADFCAGHKDFFFAFSLHWNAFLDMQPSSTT